MSNFSFSYSVFKRLLLQTRKNQGLFGKGLKYGDYYDFMDRTKVMVQFLKVPVSVN